MYHFTSNHVIIDIKIIHFKKCWVVTTHIWVKYGQTPKVGLKM